ncbi:2-amino-4-hydroxy-6-hydroxymethyldihydropteridine diphosphokinase [Vampirovibrio sp.]|uniref:2-amino-4-hydroxy-6- hydroxymethyldihydropteridine diphosphokinase n=1 Tax=Vampirovibrio sp. TaxID=2717857 RepID=UPI003593209E
MSETVRAYVALGSNMGERVLQVRQAIGLLQAHGAIRLRQISQFLETEPVGIQEERDPQWFVNAVVGIDTEFSPSQLLSVCLSIERQLGRTRDQNTPVNGYLSRTMDIDILFYGDQIISEPGLEVPHPRLHQRFFALTPMVDVAPAFIHPVLGLSIRELYDTLKQAESSNTPQLTGAPS